MDRYRVLCKCGCSAGTVTFTSIIVEELEEVIIVCKALRANSKKKYIYRMIHNYKIPTYRIYYKENDKEYATSIYVDNEEEIELLLYRLNFLAKNKKYFIKSVKNEKDV